MSNRASRGARRRRNRRSRKGAAARDELVEALVGPDPDEPALRITPRLPTSQFDEDGEPRRLRDNELDPSDDLSDTEGEKGRARSAAADKLNSSFESQDRVEITVRIPHRFHVWLLEYAALHQKEISEVVDFALRQIWREDPHRMINQTASLTRERFKELFPDA